jgi:hypothetical protein
MQGYICLYICLAWACSIPEKSLPDLCDIFQATCTSFDISSTRRECSGGGSRSPNG